jgi:hypothetical protein
MADKVWSAVRLDAAGQVDDVAVTADLFRLERMDTGVFWAAAYRGGKRVTFLIESSAPITVHVSDDDIGCKDDSKGGR